MPLTSGTPHKHIPASSPAASSLLPDCFKSLDHLTQGIPCARVPEVGPSGSKMALTPHAPGPEASGLLVPLRNLIHSLIRERGVLPRQGPLSFRHILRGSQLASVGSGSRQPGFELQLFPYYSVT